MVATAADVNDLRRGQAVLTRNALSDTVALVNALDSFPPSEREAILKDVLPEVVGPYRSNSVDLGVEFYSRTHSLDVDSDIAARAATVPVMDDVIGASIYKGDPAKFMARLGGVVKKYVLNGSRSYALDSFNSVGEKWVRAAAPDACPFCRILATIGANGGPAYTSSAEAGGSRGFHDNCRCEPVLLSKFKQPDYARDWMDEYVEARDRADSTDISDLTREMRAMSK